MLFPSQIQHMKIKYFADTDTLYIEFSDQEISETRDLDENALLDLDAAGNVCAITLEHASARTEVQQVTLASMLHQSATATFQSHALTGFRSVGVLDIVSAMPARSLVAKASHDAPLARLVTRTGATCWLEGIAA
jgi:uncharacterized protein YuzE